MPEVTLNPTPRTGAVLAEQVRAVGLSMRREALVAGVLLGIAVLAITVEALRGGNRIPFHPEHWVVPGLAGLVFAVAAWRWEDRFGGGGFLWTLPVDRRRHALARVGAGWVWLMAVVALFVLWLLALAIASGGSIVGMETLRMIPAYPLTGPEPLAPAVVRSIRAAPQPVLWLVPFTSATLVYLLASAVALGTRHPWRWTAGTVLVLVLIGAATEMSNAEGLAAAPARSVEWVILGPYGLETVLVANSMSLMVETSLSTGEDVVVWRGLPHAGRWAVATLLWMTFAGAALWAAAPATASCARAVGCSGRALLGPRRVICHPEGSVAPSFRRTVRGAKSKDLATATRSARQEGNGSDSGRGARGLQCGKILRLAPITVAADIAAWPLAQDDRCGALNVNLRNGLSS